MTCVSLSILMEDKHYAMSPLRERLVKDVSVNWSITKKESISGRQLLHSFLNTKLM